jgi:hypothetical protein
MEKDRNVVLKAVQEKPKVFLYLDKEFKKDREIALAFVKQCYEDLKYVDESLKNDREFILEIVNEVFWCFPYIDDQLKMDKEIVVAGLRNCRLKSLIENEKSSEENWMWSWYCFKKTRDYFYNDPDVFLAAYGRLNIYHSERLNKLCTINFIFQYCAFWHISDF